ncbi:MAG: TetR/AcrR family transcriptional regulator [Clostridiales bacterium]|jgi:probable dihydroxyacetone kinase regulator|nr:TetR/AcrR family transcriptional regulator [Clostridiales bacterium]
MKHEVTTLATQKALGSSLKKFLAAKTFSKVTVSEIAEDCGVSRKTFYYHFDDMHALLKWMLEQEAINIVKKFDLIVDYEEAMMFIRDYVERNDHVLRNIYNSVSRDALKGFFYADFIDIVRDVVEKTEKECQITASEDFKDFLCRFYAEAIAGMLIECINDRSVRNWEKITQYIHTIFRASFPSILRSVGLPAPVKK